MYEVVTPAKAGVQAANSRWHWIPGSAFPLVTFAGMTAVSYFIGPEQSGYKFSWNGYKLHLDISQSALNNVQHPVYKYKFSISCRRNLPEMR